MIHVSESSNRTSNTALAAALTAVGVPLAEKPFIKIVDGAKGERTIWMFESTSYDGKYKTSDLIAAWKDPAWHMANPEHPFAYIACALKNREWLVDKVKKECPIVEMRRNGKTLFLPLTAPVEVADKFIRML